MLQCLELARTHPLENLRYDRLASRVGAALAGSVLARCGVACECRVGHACAGVYILTKIVAHDAGVALSVRGTVRSGVGVGLHGGYGE